MVLSIVSFFAGSFCGAMCLAFFVGSNRKHSEKYKDETVFTESPLETLTKEEQEKVVALVDKMMGKKGN